MNERVLQMIKAHIDRILSIYPDASFKIGKTTDEERREMEYANEGYNFFFPIAQGNANLISEAEKALIKIFKTNPQCYNEQIGGGNPNANILYLALSCQITDIESLFNDIVHEPLNI